MKLALILSNDWELFGDGSGNYFEIQHKPLEDFLSLADEHNARVTVFAEIGQQWAHQQLRGTEAWAGEIVDAWENIVKETVRRGSDVQLHLHTQWLHAAFKEKKWQLDFDNWAISSLSAEDIFRLLSDGKEYLENLLKPVNSNYACIAFRAGAYCIEPSNVVIQQLLRAGIQCDSSVTKGLHDSMFYDYRDAHATVRPWYSTSDDVKYGGSSKTGVLEIPIAADPGMDSPIMRKFLPNIFYKFRFGAVPSQEDIAWSQERNRVGHKRYPMSQRPFMGKKFRSLSWLASKGISMGAFQLDYDHMPASIFVRCVERIQQSKELRSLRDKDIVVPIMASGHVKNMHNVENLRRIMEGLEKRLPGEIVYWNLQQAAEYCQSNPVILA